MNGLSDPAVIRSVLTKAGFSFKKSLGQNFLTDPTVCPRMACEAAADGETFALEIGPGAGVLTNELADRFDSVLAIELDERLRPVLAETLADKSNVEVIFGDAMKLDLAALIKEKAQGKKVSVCANLPYYITSPLIMGLLEKKLPISSITVMVQKEAAERLCAEVGSREAGAVTAAVAYYSEASMLFDVSRSSFMPQPDVDSTVIRLRVREVPPVEVADEKAFFAYVKAAFGQRRKTMVNSLSSLGGFAKDTVVSALEANGLSSAVRSEALTLCELANVFNTLYISERK